MERLRLDEGQRDERGLVRDIVGTLAFRRVRVLPPHSAIIVELFVVGLLDAGLRHNAMAGRNFLLMIVL